MVFPKGCETDPNLLVTEWMEKIWKLKCHEIFFLSMCQTLLEQMYFDLPYQMFKKHSDNKLIA